MKNIFFRGPIRIGKSTQLRGYINAHTKNIIGLYGQRIISNDNLIVGYQSEVIVGLPVPDVNIEYNNDLENIFIFQKKVDLSCYKKQLSKLLQLVKNNAYAAVVLDEIGGFELSSVQVMQELNDVLSTNIPCVGILKEYKQIIHREGTIFKEDYTKEYQHLTDLIKSRGEIIDVSLETLPKINEYLNTIFK